MTLKTKCSVVIRCFNEEDHIGKLLSGLLRQTVDHLEIIVVDSGSTDDTLAIARRFPVKIVHISPDEFSFGRALNRGCEAATGDYVVAASAHVYPVYDSWLARLTAPLADPKTALAYGKQLGNEVTSFSEHQIFAKWFPEGSIAAQGHPFCNNANAAIKRELWLSQPYNEELTGLEDLDWAKRAIAAGFDICYVAEAPVVHVHLETPRRILNRYRREAIALKQIMPNHRFSFFDFWRLFIANAASDYYHAVKDRVFLKNLLNVPVFRFMQFWGTYRGFAQHGPIARQLRERFYYPRASKRQPKAIEPLPVGNEIDYTVKEKVGPS
jgi:rhamnosyltransferase